MKFSLFDFVHCRTWERRGPPQDNARIMREHLQQWQEAERLGFDGAWVTEHHFSPYNLTPSPSVFLSAAAAMTSRLKLGTMIYVVNFHHPWRLAEEIAMLDCISNGRLMLGLGRSPDMTEYDHFDMAPEEGRGRFREGLELMKQAFTGQPVTFEGEFYRMNDAVIWPQPVQQPYPPIVAAAVQPTTFEWAGEQGYGASSLMTDHQTAAYYHNLFQSAREKHGLPRDPKQFYLARHVYVRESHDQAIEEARGPMLEFFKMFYHDRVFKNREQLDHMPATFEGYGEFHKANLSGKLTYESLIERGALLAGDPKSVAEQIQKTKETAGLENLMCIMSIGPMSHEETLKSLRLFGEKVLPEFAS
jgi:alkanesulfonate monooxygenase SsuD/methylene tetrahydromethanopterin reductase-like flavin-dependent oxidoreductase (luciferase family)